MAVKSDYVSGTISLTNGSASFSGTGTGWLAAGFREGDTIIDITGATEYMGVIALIDANGSGTLTKPWEGPTLTDAAYRMRYQPDGSRVSAQARNLVELLGNGNLQAVAGLEGSANRLPMFTGPGAMTLVSKADLTSGADYDVQVDDLAARAAYDGMDQGFAVLVANTGDGRAAIYSKVSNAVGDWSDPAYVTGPVYDLEIGTVEQIPYGEPPKVAMTPDAGGASLNFKIPAGMFIEPGTIVTLGPGQNANWDWEPIEGGYRVNLSIPRGNTGNIDGVTPFWQGRITQDATAAAARAGLQVPGISTPNDFTGIQKMPNLSGVRGGGQSVGPAYFVFETSDGIRIGYVGVGTSDQHVRLHSDSGGIILRAHPSSNIEFRGRVVFETVVPDETSWAMLPIGVPVPLLTDLAGVVAPPTNRPYRFIKLTASDAYNSGVLASESVSGSAPLVQATAVISLAGSPLNGQTVRLINTERRALRAGNAGSVEEDQMQQITGAIVGGSGVFATAVQTGGSGALDMTGSGTLTGGAGSGFYRHNISLDSANSPGARAGNETRSKNLGVDYFMRIL